MKNTFDDYHGIKCPHCDEEQDFMDMLGEIISYHAEEGAKEFDCQSCGQKYFLQEHVRRRWDVAPTLAEVEEI